MAKPNLSFNLNVNDINLIEEALMSLQQHNPKYETDVADLRAKIHHQKNWYRPEGIYVSG